MNFFIMKDFPFGGTLPKMFSDQSCKHNLNDVCNSSELILSKLRVDGCKTFMSATLCCLFLYLN